MKYCFLFLAAWIGLVQAADDKRERIYAAVMLQTLKIGEPVWLKTGKQKFLSLYTQTEQPKSMGTAIILHDQGTFANQAPLIYRLRTELPQHRWTTLSLQLPVLEEGAPAGDYFKLERQALARIETAITFLKNNNIEKIVLVGQGLGASFALDFAANKPNPVKALVLISLKLPPAKEKRTVWIKKLSVLTIPVLDIYAEQDAAQTVLTARKRRLSSRNNPNYQQLVLTNTDHQYAHNEALLIKRVYSWLSRQFNKRN